MSSLNKQVLPLLTLWAFCFIWVYLPYIIMTIQPESFGTISIIATISFFLVALEALNYFHKYYNVSYLSLLGLDIRKIASSSREILLLGFLITIRIPSLLTIGSVGGVPSWLLTFPRWIIPILAIVRWLIFGFITFSVMMALSVEVLDREEKLTSKTIILLFLGLCLFYNAPLTYFLYGTLLTVSLVNELGDIVMLGIAILLYLKTRNAMGIILIYAFVYEGPVNQAILYGWGYNAYLIYLTIWLVVSLICLQLTLKQKIRK